MYPATDLKLVGNVSIFDQESIDMVIKKYQYPIHVKDRHRMLFP